jgi:hypothetical protein
MCPGFSFSNQYRVSILHFVKKGIIINHAQYSYKKSIMHYLANEDSQVQQTDINNCRSTNIHNSRKSANT